MKKQNTILGVTMTEWRKLAGLSDPYALPSLMEVTDPEKRRNIARSSPEPGAGLAAEKNAAKERDAKRKAALAAHIAKHGITTITGVGGRGLAKEFKDSGPDFERISLKDKALSRVPGEVEKNKSLKNPDADAKIDLIRGRRLRLPGEIDAIRSMGQKNPEKANEIAQKISVRKAEIAAKKAAPEPVKDQPEPKMATGHGHAPEPKMATGHGHAPENKKPMPRIDQLKADQEKRNQENARKRAELFSKPVESSLESFDLDYAWSSYLEDKGTSVEEFNYLIDLALRNDDARLADDLLAIEGQFSEMIESYMEDESSPLIHVSDDEFVAMIVSEAKDLKHRTVLAMESNASSVRRFNVAQKLREQSETGESLVDGIDRGLLWSVFLESDGISAEDFNDVLSVAIRENDYETMVDLLVYESQLDEILGTIGYGLGKVAGLGAKAVKGVAQGAASFGKGVARGVSGVGQGLAKGASAVGRGVASGAQQFSQEFGKGYQGQPSTRSVEKAQQNATWNRLVTPPDADQANKVQLNFPKDDQTPAPAAQATPAQTPSAPAQAPSAPAQTTPPQTALAPSAPAKKKPGLLGLTKKAVGSVAGRIAGAARGAVQGMRSGWKAGGQAANPGQAESLAGFNYSLMEDVGVSLVEYVDLYDYAVINGDIKILEDLDIVGSYFNPLNEDFDDLNEIGAYFGYLTEAAEPYAARGLARPQDIRPRLGALGEPKVTMAPRGLGRVARDFSSGAQRAAGAIASGSRSAARTVATGTEGAGRALVGGVKKAAGWVADFAKGLRDRFRGEDPKILKARKQYFSSPESSKQQWTHFAKMQKNSMVDRGPEKKAKPMSAIKRIERSNKVADEVRRMRAEPKLPQVINFNGESVMRNQLMLAGYIEEHISKRYN